MKRNRLAILLIVLALGMADRGGGASHADSLVVPGTGACETVMRDLAATFNDQNPLDQVTIPPSTGSGGGIRSVAVDDAVLARVARPLKENETKSGLRYRPLAQDAVVFVVGAGVDVRDVSSDQVVQVFSGKVRNWQEVGGSKAPIRVLTREPDDSSLSVIRRQIKPFQDMTFAESAKCIYHDYEMVQMLAKYRNTIGWLTGSTLSHRDPSIKPLAIDGLEPTPENILNGSYKLVEEYGLVYKPNKLTALAKKFMEYVCSDSGKQLMRESGLIPLGKGPAHEDD